MKTVAQIVTDGAKEFGIDLPLGAGASFETYCSILVKRANDFNLTAITQAEDIARLHFLDSLALLLSADYKNKHIIDVGSGAGFPGVPIKIAQPSVNLTLLDATGKRVAFLSELCVALGIDAQYIHARAEEWARIEENRERFDIALSRAVAQLNILSELSLPFVKVGGVFLAMKGVNSAHEIEQAQRAISLLGAKLENTLDYMIPETDIVHRTVIIRKTSPTPTEYPRKFAKILKNPI